MKISKNMFSKERFNKKRIGAFYKTLAIAVSISIMLLIGVWFLSEYIDGYTTAETPFPAGIQLDGYEEYMESQKDVESDISGMSVYDKYVMGLNTEDGSDTDYDGLTDKEEIEIYGTDPLAASTAGDLYSDGYKAEHGMDLFAYAEYEGNMEFPYIECSEVSIVPETPTDFYTVVQDYTDVYSLEEYNIKKVYKAYCLYNYGGAVSIDVSDILEQNDISLAKMSVWVAESLFVTPGSTELHSCSYEEKDNVITLDYAFDDDLQYVIFLTGKKQSVVSAMLEDMTDSFWFSNSLAAEEDVVGTGVVYGSPILDQFFGVDLKGYYGETDNEDDTRKVYNCFLKYCDNYKGMSISNANIHKESYVNILAKQKFFDSFLSYFELPMDNNDTSRIRNAFFVYTNYEEICNENAITEDETKKVVNFDKTVDELPFQNFASYIAPYGNCAGISHLTAYLYNTKSLPSEGVYTCVISGEDQSIEWDLTIDADNDTLQDPGLYDYKTADFIDDISDSNYYIQNGLSDGEQEFVNMVGCFWAEGNSKIDGSFLKECGTYEDYSVLESMIAYLDEGKILDVYLYMQSDSGHAVNIYGYEETGVEGQINFYVYDSNIPCDDRSGYDIDRTDGTCMMQTVKITDKAGNAKFAYLYWPMSTYETYQASNCDFGTSDYCMFIAMDENWNILN